MCGRYALEATGEAIKSRFNLKVGCVLKPRYNIAPKTWIPIITAEKIQFSYWGFTPSWITVDDGGEAPSFINARVESIDIKPSFRQAFKSNRCIIPASGYYEWKLINGKKQPFFIYSPTELIIGLAGVWGAWRQPNGEMIETVAIMTQPAFQNIAHIHERMPVLINESQQACWLDNKTQGKAIISDILKNQQNVSFHAVATAMNNPEFDQRACLLPL